MSTNVLSLPVVQPQPADTQYPIASLDLFKHYNRDTYSNTFGESAPVFDPSRPVKDWKDDSPNAGNYLIFTVGPNGPALTPVTMSKQIASTVNLLGKPIFAVYSPVNTDAYVVQLDAHGTEVGPRATLNPRLLSLKSEADALAALTGGVVSNGSFVGVYTDVYPSDEPRRIWVITTSAGVINVGDLLGAMASGGVGAPGHWDPTKLTAGIYKWIVDPVPDGSETSHIYTGDACRPLLDNEQFVVIKSMFGTLYYVGKKGASSAGGTGAGLTPDQATLLQEAHDAAIAAKTNSQQILNIVQANVPPTA